MTDAPSKDKGALRAFLNPDKVPGDDKPTFSGKLTFPGEDIERSFVLWSRMDKNRAVILSGRTVSNNALEQIAGMVAEKPKDGASAATTSGKRPNIKPREIVLFENKHKGDKRPDFYGWHDTGVAGRAPLRLAVWAKTDTNGRAYITGNAQDSDPSPEPDQQQDTEPAMSG